MTATFESVDALVEDARTGLRRLTPVEAQARVEAGAVLVDIRPEWQRVADGVIADSLIIERNHLEWRLHPGSGACLPEARADQEWIVYCTEGYASSLAAASLRSLGLDATDLAGGIVAWRNAGLPLVVAHQQ